MEFSDEDSQSPTIPMKRSLAFLPLLFVLSALSAPAQVYGGGFDKDGSWFGIDSGEGFGHAASCEGDMDGDGISEIAVGTPGASSGGFTNSGRLEIFSGGTGALLYQYTGSSNFENVGWAVAGLGDVDGDTVPDFVASALGGIGGPHQGVVTIYSGATGGVVLTVPTPAGAQAFGDALASLGDVDGDTVGDFAVGASNSDTAGLSNNGAVFVISGFDGSVIQTLDGDASNILTGRSVANAGDVDGDGINDVVAGAIWSEPGGIFRAGSAFLWSTATGTLLHRYDGTQVEQEFGTSVAGMGDVDGDGFPDVAVGAPADAQPGGVREGSVTYCSSSTGSQLFKFFGSVDDEDVGSSLANAGDVDEDGEDDLLVGASGSALGGRAYLLNALGDRLHVFESVGPTDAFGASVAGMGDADGDGDLDLLIGATAGENLGVDAGAVHRYSFKPFLTATATSISAAAGGTIDYDMDFPGEFLFSNNLLYAMLVSGTGTGPNLFGGWLIPLTVDFLFLRTKNGQYPSALSGGSGALDANGDASATLTFAPGQASGLVGNTYWIAALYYEQSVAGSFIHGTSRAVVLNILP